MGPNLDSRKCDKQHEALISVVYTARHETAATALVEASEERWAKLMSKSLYLLVPQDGRDDRDLRTRIKPKSRDGKSPQHRIASTNPHPIARCTQQSQLNDVL